MLEKQVEQTMMHGICNRGWQLGLALLLVCGCGSGGNIQRSLKRAVRDMENGRYVRAKTRLLKAINRHPGEAAVARAYNYLGIVHWELKDIQRAVEAFSQARRRNPNLPEPSYNLGIIMYITGEAYQATALLREAALMDVKDTTALEYLGHLYMREGDGIKARRNLYDALARAPESARILTALGNVELQLDGPDAALTLWMQALEKDHTYAPALYNLAVVYDRRLNEEAEAREFARQFAELSDDPERIQALERLLEETMTVELPEDVTPIEEPEDVTEPEATEQEPRPQPEPSALNWEERARAMAQEGNTEEVMRICVQEAEKARRANDRERRGRALKLAVELCFEQPRAYNLLGRYYEDIGQNEAAFSMYKKATALDPGYHDAHRALYPLALERNEWDTALVSLRRLTDNVRPDGEALWQLARLYDRALNMNERAVQTYRRFTRIFTDDPRVMDAERRLNELLPEEEATEDTETTAAETSPETLPAPRDEGRKLTFKRSEARNLQAAVQAFNRGTVYQSRNDWDAAETYYLRAIENDNQFAMAFFNLGAVYSVKGEHDLARDAYLHAIERRPDLTAARYNLALLYYQDQKFPEAITQLTRAVSADPNHAASHYLLGLTYAQNEETADRARAHYRRFLALAPDDPGAPAVRQWLSSR